MDELRREILTMSGVQDSLWDDGRESKTTRISEHITRPHVELAKNILTTFSDAKLLDTNQQIKQLQQDNVSRTKRSRQAIFNDDVAGVNQTKQQAMVEHVQTYMKMGLIIGALKSDEKKVPITYHKEPHPSTLIEANRYKLTKKNYDNVKKNYREQLKQMEIGMIEENHKQLKLKKILSMVEPLEIKTRLTRERHE